MSESVRQTLSLVREQIDVGARNLELVGDPNARRITTSLTVDQIGGSKTHRTSLSESRSVNILQERAYVEQVTRLGNNNTYTEFLSDLQSVIGGEKDPQVSRLVKTIDSFFAQAKILEASSGHSMRQAFINKAEEVSAAITGASKKVTDLRFDADKRLKQSAHSANGTIKALFNLNQQMLISSSPIRLHDKRDQLVRELAHNFDIKASYGASGTVKIEAKSSGELIVASDYYSQFSYDGVGSIDAIIENNDYPPLMITQFGRDGKETHSKVFIGGSDDSTMSVSGGQWSALIDLRDKILPETGDKIKALGSNFANKLNAIHNNGSPFPPKDYFKSSIDISRGQDLEWGDPFTIHFVSKEGNQLLGGAGRLNPATIDMRSLASTALSGKATIADLIKELNEKLDLAPSRPRAAIGAITDGVPVQVPGEYLLNNIQLRARGPVNAADGNSFTFDLDLQGSSHFGSNIEVLEARSEDIGGANQQVVATDQLPGSFRLEKDTNIATGQNIKVQGATAPRIITLRVRITGDNGVVSEGTVSFPVNPAAVVNDRLAFDGAIAGATTGAFNPVPLTSHSGVARAKLVDDNGIEIDPNSGQSGKLVIETNDDSYGLVIQGGNFGSLFGFNDLFKFDDRTGELNLNQEIVDDVSKLSIGRAEKDAGIATAHTVGDVKAKATLVFANLGGLVGGGAETVTITGIGALPPVAFVFVNALNPIPNPNEVLVADGLFGPDGLMNRINAHPQLRGLVLAGNTGGNLTIESKAAGTGGNAITVASALGAATVDINGNGAANNNGATALNAGNGIAGTNKVEASQVFGYTMKPRNQQVLQDLSELQTELVTIAADSSLPNTVATLSGLATIVTGLLSDSVNEAKIESDVAKIVLERTDAQVKKDSGISKEQEYLRVLDLARLMSTLSHLLSMLQNTLVKAEDIIFSR